MKLRLLFTTTVIAIGLLIPLIAQSPVDDAIVRVRLIERMILDAAPRVSVARDATMSQDDPCRDRGWDDDYYRHCEVREESMPAGPLTVDAGRNGGIRVEGWDQNVIRVQAVVQANARDESRARELASAVQVHVGGGRVSASGPDADRREWWSVSFQRCVVAPVIGSRWRPFASTTALRHADQLAPPPGRHCPGANDASRRFLAALPRSASGP